MISMRKRSPSIRRRVAVLVGFGVAASLVAALWALWSASRSVAYRVLEEQQRSSASLALYFDQELRRNLAELSALTRLPEDWQNGNARRSLHAAFLRSPLFVAVADVGSDRRLLWQESRHGEGVLEPLLALDELGVALASGRQGVAHLAGGQRSQVALFAPVRDWNGHVTNVACALVSPDAAAWVEMLDHVRAPSGMGALLDKRDRVVVSRGLTASPDDLVSRATLAVVPWKIVVRQPRNQALGPLSAERRRLAWLLPLLLGVALFLSWGATRSVTQPLKTLGQSAQRIAEGNLQIQVPPQGDDEIGQLAAALESMRIALKRSLDDLTSSHEALEQRVRERTQELRLVLSKFVSVQEDERKRIARELHDETCQTIAALAMKLDAAMAAATAQASHERLSEARAFAGRCLAEVHALIYELRPSVLDDLGLYPAIRWLTEHHLGPAGIASRCEVTSEGPSLGPERETTLFRAVQEAIRNVARHSGATQALIQVESRDRRLVVEIEDDGRGFDLAGVTEPSPSGRGLGILGMRERLALVGGSAEVVSSVGEGTRVVLSVPFPEEERLVQDPHPDR